MPDPTEKAQLTDAATLIAAVYARAPEQFRKRLFELGNKILATRDELFPPPSPKPPK